MPNAQTAQINAIVDLYLDVNTELVEAQPVILVAKNDDGITAGLGFVGPDGAQFYATAATRIEHDSPAFPDGALLAHCRQEFPTADDMHWGMRDQRQRESEAMHLAVDHAAITLRHLIDIADAAFTARQFGALPVAAPPDLRACIDRIANGHRFWARPAWLDRVRDVSLVDEDRCIPVIDE